MLDGWGWEKAQEEGGSFGRVSDTAPVLVPASSPAFAREVLALLSTLPLSFQILCEASALFSFADFVEKNGDNLTKLGPSCVQQCPQVPRAPVTSVEGRQD